MTIDSKYRLVAYVRSEKEGSQLTLLDAEARDSGLVLAQVFEGKQYEPEAYKSQAGRQFHTHRDPYGNRSS